MEQASRVLQASLERMYDQREASGITELAMENISGLGKVDRFLHRTQPLTSSEAGRLNWMQTELLKHRPIQYVLQEAWFCGMKFFVNEQVLIPRPETEELVDWVVRDLSDRMTRRSQNSPLTVLDAGTGSGCLAVALKKKLPSARLMACDISEGALQVARRNAELNQVELEWLQLDLLDPDSWNQLPAFDCVVSNPPYIPITDKSGMAAHVVGYEPHLALFVPEGDPLIFYEALADMCRLAGSTPTSLYAEIHEERATGVYDLFAQRGFSPVEIRRDIFGKERMVKANLSRSNGQRA
jgi:release factor glutamine methyltransferase